MLVSVRSKFYADHFILRATMSASLLRSSKISTFLPSFDLNIYIFQFPPSSMLPLCHSVVALIKRATTINHNIQLYISAYQKNACILTLTSHFVVVEPL